ncbi:MAG: WG repeat-containing protein, partial [Ruminiclostridium sp.]|nr:WG repeat-containing protein [Ruminiclostridium sp.]
MKKRIVSLSLALLMTLGLLPSAAFAAGKEDQPQRGVLSYEEFIRPQYEDAQSFSEDLAAVKKNGKWGYINEENKTVIPFQYAYAWPFNEGKAVVCKEVKTLTDAPNEKEESYSKVYSA